MFEIDWRFSHLSPVLLGETGDLNGGSCRLPFSRMLGGPLAALHEISARPSHRQCAKKLIVGDESPAAGTPRRALKY
jgi:hypothetical protein